MYCYVRFLSKLWCCSFTLVRGRLVIPIYYFPTCSCCEGTHSPPNQIWLPKQEKSVKGKRGEKCSPNRMHVCWKYCRSLYSEALIPKNTSYVQVGFHTQVLYCTLGLACIEFWVTCTIKIVYLWSYCYTSCVLLKENWKKTSSAVSSVIIVWACKFCMTQMISEDFMMLCLSLLTLTLLWWILDSRQILISHNFTIIFASLYQFLFDYYIAIPAKCSKKDPVQNILVHWCIDQLLLLVCRPCWLTWLMQNVIDGGQYLCVASNQFLCWLNV